MDWFSWLSKTGLGASLVYEYGVSMAENQLEEDDISYFNHEFLQSMGISIAKHRLEILKLARKHNAKRLSPIIIALKRTKSCFSKYMRPPWAWARRREDSSALALVPYKGGMLRRNRRVPVGSKSARGPLLLTNGHGIGTPMFFHSSRMQTLVLEDHHYWSSAVEEEPRWDTMFHNLKPT